METKQTVNINGVNLLVEGYLDGDYYPETREQPAEYPEFVITNITTEDDITELLSDAILDNIYEQIQEQ